MIEQPDVEMATTDGSASEASVDTESTVLVEEELLVEEVSIDGMCGVY